MHANSFRSIRGRALIGCVFDECAIWRDDTSANPDLEVYRAVRPSLVRCGGLLVAISTPYRKSGLLYRKFEQHFDRDDDAVLVVKGPTSNFNPTIDQNKIAKELAHDPEGARSECEAEFRSDISALFDEQVIGDAVHHGRPLELPPRGFNYLAFTDASAGRNDAFSICIGHTEGKKDEATWTCDVVRGVAAPFNPRSVAQEYAQLARAYGCTKIIGDNFSGEWVATAFRDCGTIYETCKLRKSTLYLEALPHFNRGAVSLPHHDRLLRELRQLERRVMRSGKDAVDHPRAGSDDLANSVCGALYCAMHELHKPRVSWGTIDVNGFVHWKDDEPRQRIRIVHVSEQEALRQKAEGTW